MVDGSAMTADTRNDDGAWRVAIEAMRGSCRGFGGELYATAVTTFAVGRPRGMRIPADGGACPGHSLPWKLRPRHIAFGQPNGVRERGAAECRGAEQGRRVRFVEQSADEKLR